MDKLEDIMTSTLDSLKNVIESDNIAGKPISMQDGTMIFPLSKITVGIASGGGQYSEKNESSQSVLPFAGGGGGGMTITPIGFLVCRDDRQTLLRIDKGEVGEKWKDLVTASIDFFKNSKK
ncbi:MAG: spore germination protein GerW family protein [Clostridia bacterium]